MKTHPVDAVSRRIFAATVVAQCAIVVTGGLVRITKSGLGCPTFPQCTEASYVPEADQFEGIHKFIEFGNRMLTFVLLAIVIASIVAALRQMPRRGPLVALAAAGVVGIAAQIILGGITVLTGLNPYTVSAHFLVSMTLIVAAVALYERGNDDGDAPVTPLVRQEIRILSRALLAVGAAMIVVGTVVTGTGPHSGDANADVRYPFEFRTVAQIHVDVVILFLGLTIAMLLALRLTDGPAVARRRTWILLWVTLAQGLIGYVQYFLDVPEALVALHLIGACAVWVCLLRVSFALRERAAIHRDETVEETAVTTAA